MGIVDLKDDEDIDYYETLKKRGLEFVEVHSHRDHKLYLCNLNDKSFQLGIISPFFKMEFAFVIKQPKVLRKFFEQALRLLPEE